MKPVTDQSYFRLVRFVRTNTSSTPLSTARTLSPFLTDVSNRLFMLTDLLITVRSSLVNVPVWERQ